MSEDVASIFAKLSEYARADLCVVFVIDDDASMRAQRTLASADDAVASSHVRLATDQVAIFLAFGGGWE